MRWFYVDRVCSGSKVPAFSDTFASIMILNVLKSLLQDLADKAVSPDPIPYRYCKT